MFSGKLFIGQWVKRKPAKMSRLYDTIEPAVIDEEMLQTAVEEQGPKDEAGKIARDEGIDFGDVTSLRLDYKSNCLFLWKLLSDTIQF